MILRADRAISAANIGASGEATEERLPESRVAYCG